MAKRYSKKSLIKSKTPANKSVDVKDLVTRDKVDCLYWSNKYLTTEKAEPLEFAKRPYLKEIYQQWAQDMVIKKAGQVGISNYAIDKAIWLAANYKVNIIYTMPTGGDVSTFSQSRVDPIIKNSKSNIFRNVDNVKVKQIGDSFIYFKGTFDEGQAISVPSDFNIHDEIDFSNQDIIEMYNERLSASRIKWKLRLSTPTISNFGIDVDYNNSDKREWFTTCQSCSMKQIITENHIDAENNIYRCERCHKPINPMTGEWVATAKSNITGYHITQLIAGWILPAEILHKKSTYKFKRDYYNYVLGETYDGGQESLTRLDLISIIAKQNELSSMPGYYTAGIDWGDTSWLIIKNGLDIIYRTKITGDTRTHVQQILNIIYRFKDIRLCADHGYGDIKNNELSDKLNPAVVTQWDINKFYTCNYTDSGNDYPPRIDEQKHKITIDRTRSMEERIIEIKSGKMKICGGDDTEEFIKHFTNIIQKKEIDGHGNIRLKYDRISDDHYFHAFNYASILPKIEVAVNNNSDNKMYVPSTSSRNDDDFSMGNFPV